MTVAVSIKQLDVVFGAVSSECLALLDQGKSRQEIIDATGTVVGVRDANIEVHQGEICVLMGLSGSGKSSLLRAVNGLNPVTRGELLLRDGEQMVDIAQCSPKRLRQLREQRVSMVFQKFALMPWLSVQDNVAFGLEMMGIGKTERRRRADQQLEMVGLAEWRDKLPHELSGGMQQRVGLARAFAMDSDILLMDEPFSALDPLIRAQLQDELIELQKRLNKTILFVSHDLDEALKIGTHIAIMESAEIIQHGTPEDIVLNPCNAYVEDFVAHTNPLNVLVGRTLMTPWAELERRDGAVVLDAQYNISAHPDGSDWQIQRDGQPLAMQHIDDPQQLPSEPIQEVVFTHPEVSMRQAIEICYQSQLPLILQEQGQPVGVLSHRQFYHALLGKHFARQSE